LLRPRGTPSFADDPSVWKALDAALLKRLVLTPKMCDLIEDELLPCGKRQYVMKGAA